MLRRLFPHPYLTLLLILTWMLLVNGWALGSLVFAIILGTIIPILTAPYWENRPHLRSIPAMAEYVLIVLWDIVVSNFIVARIVLFMPNSQLRPAWIAVPIDLRTPEAITVLAGTITMTPGTVTSDMSGCGRVLLVHCLHAPDPDSVRDGIKSRYEARLMRIFE
ncbi:MAG TPA: Na+/H+ antiporter subunit E [Paracoccaceae bacterium]|nr:Na+/H+ antiporter subunit E [Paracoccaceae bacterium]HMO72455.1 Na+/H+ antiporter subunit E [Paracoccaceae bacterium]